MYDSIHSISNHCRTTVPAWIVEHVCTCTAWHAYSRENKAACEHSKYEASSWYTCILTMLFGDCITTHSRLRRCIPGGSHLLNSHAPPGGAHDIWWRAILQSFSRGIGLSRAARRGNWQAWRTWLPNFGVRKQRAICLPVQLASPQGQRLHILPTSDFNNFAGQGIA